VTTRLSSIEPALPADAPTIRALASLVIVETFDADPALQDDIIGNVSANIDLWLAEPERWVHLKALDGGAIVGMVLVRDYWNLCNLFVHADHQGRGLGSALLESACAPCAGRSPKGAIWLNAAPNAVGFYRRLGFVERPATRPLPPGALAMLRPV
jgi:ribosomal protein S18 acetylase RimI-like enzyme